MNSASEAAPQHSSDRHIVLSLLALLAFVLCAGGQASAHASVGSPSAGSCTAPGSSGDDEAVPSDAARIGAVSETRPDCELTAAEAEDIENDASVDAATVHARARFEPLTAFVKPVSHGAQARTIAQPLLGCVLARGPP